MKPYCYTIFFLLWALCLSSQNETRQWYFGNDAGLDFTTEPPTVLTGTLSTIEGSASMADAAGNLLFYTTGSDVYTKQHLPMANGSGLAGNFSSTQAAIIVKQPGSSNLYYIFTTDYSGGPLGINYSIVDMSLAAGMGSVTVKNVQLYTSSTEKVTAVQHCNGVDVWIVSHDMNSNVFRTFLFSASGVNAVPVLSPVGTVHSNGAGYMKPAPNGRHLGLALFGMGAFELVEFNNSTGVVSNAVTLATPGNLYPYGCEFSPDGTKLYGTASNFNFANCTLYQWSLCSASVSASQYVVATPTADINGMQLAPNGKIYVARNGAGALDVIASPDQAGAACNYQSLAQSIVPHVAYLGMPNIMTALIKAPVSPLQAMGCSTATFSPPSLYTQTAIACTAQNYSITGYNWLFGDAASGAANTSSLANPIHTYPGLGTYNVRLIVSYSSCTPDTLRQSITIVSPSLSVISSSQTCYGTGPATVIAQGGTGQYTYSWTPSAQTTSIASNLTPGTYTISVYDGLGCSASTTAALAFAQLGTTVTANAVLACTAGASVTVANGSTIYTYSWSAGSSTAASIAGLPAGIYTVTVKDLGRSCVLTNTIQLSTLPVPSLSISGATLVCMNNAATFTASGASTYSWSTGQTSPTISLLPVVAGSYTVTGSNTLSACTASAVVQLSLSACTGFDEAMANNNMLRLYPNPASSLVNMDVDTDAQLFVYDQLGGLVLQMPVLAGSRSIDVWRWNNGLYLFKLVDGQRVYTDRFIKASQ